MTGYLSSRLAGANPAAARAAQRRHLESVILPRLPAEPDAPLLEIGFGLGGFLDFVRDRGHRAYEGVEVDAEAHAAAADRHPVHLTDDVPGFLEAREEGYALIVLFSVVAHLERGEAIAVMRAVRRALMPGGAVLMETFNAALPSGFYTWANDLTHRVAYTEHSLRQLLVLGGFDAIEVTGAPPPLSGGARSQVWAGARRAYLAGVSAAFNLERGAGNQPRIWDKVLLASGRRT